MDNYKNKKNDKNVLRWWVSLSIISIINIVFIIYYYIINKNTNYINLCLFSLASIYAVVCAIRSLWPRKDIEKVCIFNSKMSTPLVGRSLATIAELCFIVVIIFIMLHVNKNVENFTGNKNKNIVLTLKLILPIIIIAEILSWIGCITEFELWNAAEESLWGISGIIVSIIGILLYLSISNLKSNPKIHSLSMFLKIFTFCTICFSVFMVFDDIPMYIKRWKNKDTNKDDKVSWNEFKNDFKQKNNISFIKGIQEMNKCKKVTNSYKEWKDEIPWLTGYFTLGVWGLFILVIWYKNFSKI